MFVVEIVEDATGAVKWQSRPVAARSSAERMERGAERNLNHEKYTVRIREVDPAPVTETAEIG